MMPDGLVVRFLKATDFEAASRLLVELGRPAPTDETRADFRSIFARHVASSSTASLIAERKREAVGLLILQFRERLNWPSLEAWIPDFIVTHREHGMGAATALWKRAVELARDRGCHRLTLESGHQRLRAHRFYAREGMLDAGKFFVMELDPLPLSDDEDNGV